MDVGTFYYLGNARVQKQYDEMVQLESDGVCLFCPEHLKVDKGNRVVHDTRYWMVTPNEYPYPGAGHHFLVIPKRHVERLTDLPILALLSFWRTLKWIEREYGLKYYGLGCRNGDCEYTGATIRHVHAHVIAAQPDWKGDPIRFVMSSAPQDSSPFA